MQFFLYTLGGRDKINMIGTLNQNQKVTYETVILAADGDSLPPVDLRLSQCTSEDDLAIYLVG